MTEEQNPAPEATPSTAAAKPAPAAAKDKPLTDVKVIIRPWPKVIFLYPTLLVAIVMWLILLIGGEPASIPGSAAGAEAAAAGTVGGGEVAAPGTTEGGNAPTGAGQEGGEAATAAAAESSNLGNIFMIVFFLNLMVFSFDFSRIKSITIVIAIVGVGFGLAWADTNWDVTGVITGALGKINIQMNAQFYGWMAAFLFASLLMVLVNTRFNYYEINHREILHHHGYLGDITRVPTQGLRFNKEIYDLVEFALLRSGRLIFVTPTSHEAIVIDNVPNVNKVEDQIKDLLSVVAVRMR